MLLPRGDAIEQSPLVIDLTNTFAAEARLEEIRTANYGSATELMGYMNVAANDAQKYLGLIQYELLMAKKNYDKRKAILILDFLPDFIKEKGLKPNEDIREAFIIRDPEAYQLRDRIECLTAALYMIEGKVKSFVRAFNAAKMIAEGRRGQATGPITSIGSNTWAILEDQDRGFREEREE